MGENENEGNMIRFRLSFEDLDLLDKSQRSQGLRRCWFLLKPDIASIGDLASHIRNCFDLRHCIVLYMDDFILPSFESTCIIRDMDIIRVKKKEAKEKNICTPCDVQNLLEHSENVTVHSLLLENGSNDKEILTSCLENSIHLDPPCEIVSTKKKRKRSKGQCDEFNPENEFEPSNNSDMRKKKLVSAQMVAHTSDEEEGVVASVVQPVYIGFQSPDAEHGTQQADETQKSVLFDGGSSFEEPDKNNEKTFSQTTNNDLCLKVDGVPVSDGILPLPKSAVMPSTVDIIKHCKHIKFEILIPLRRLPVKGDILAYRYIEQPSSVHPQLSSPQVGEVSLFDCKTFQITLRPVIDYVLLLNGNPHETTGQPNTSQYKEDDLLEIEYLSLVDVRLVKAHDPKEDEKDCEDDQAKKDNWEEALLKEKGNGPGASAAGQSNGWTQWIPNKSADIRSWSLEQFNVPFAGRGNGRRAPFRGMNNRNQNRHGTNWNARRNNAPWNPNRNNTGVIPGPATDNTPSLSWTYSAPGLPNPWEEHYQNITFPPPGIFPDPGNQ